MALTSHGSAHGQRGRLPDAVGGTAPPSAPRPARVPPSAPREQDAHTPRPAASAFIIGPLADGAFLVFSPLLAMALGVVISGTSFATEPTGLPSGGTMLTLVGSIFVSAHLFIVLFRSHGNPAIFRLHPLRFTLVPCLLFAAMCASRWVAVSVSVLATWWDVYHSSMQTFGIGRIYDMKRGNDAEAGRSLDIWLNLLLYAGPILGGATLLDHVEDFDEFKEVGSVFFTAIPAYAESYARYLTWGVLALGVLVLASYIVGYWRLSRQGYRISVPKVALLVSTAVCSIVTWGFNPFGVAFFVMNFFHALQYFALVWFTEKEHMTAFFGLARSSLGKPVTLAIFLTVPFAYGCWAEIFATSAHVTANVTMVIAIMHFWYDGFIWSVRKKQLA
jgi:hypothetical protein